MIQKLWWNFIFSFYLDIQEQEIRERYVLKNTQNWKGSEVLQIMIMVTFASVKMGAVDTIARRAVIRQLMETNLSAEHRKRPGNHVECNSFSRQNQMLFHLQIIITNINYIATCNKRLSNDIQSKLPFF